MKKVIFLAIAAIAVCLSSCKEEPDGVCQMTSISFTKQLNSSLPMDCVGEITQGTNPSIKFVVPEGSDLSRIIPTFVVTPGDEVSINGGVVENGVSTINFGSASSIVVKDDRSGLSVTYAITIDYNDGKVELKSIGFYAKDNSDLEEDYVPTIADEMLVRIPGGGSGKTLYMRAEAGLNDVITVDGETAVDNLFSVDATFAIDVKLTDAIAGTSQTFVMKVGKILEYTWTKLGTITDPAQGAYSNAAYMAVDAKNDIPYIFYTEEVDVNGSGVDKGNVVKWNGSSFENVGAKGFTPGGATNHRMTINKDGVPYVMFSDAAATTTAKAISVMAYKGGSWALEGAQGFGGADVVTSTPNIVCDPVSGNPLVAWATNNRNSSYTNRRGLIVGKYDGSAWSLDGSIAGRDKTWYGYLPKFQVVGNDVYLKVADQNQASNSVYKYSGGAWSSVVSGFSMKGIGLSTVGIYTGGIAANSKGEVYLLECDDSAVNGTWLLQLFKVSGNTLEKVGNPVSGFTYTIQSYGNAALVFDKNDNPIVICQMQDGDYYKTVITTLDPETKSWTAPFTCAETCSRYEITAGAAQNGNVYVCFSSYGFAGEDKWVEYTVYKYALEADILPE